MFVYERNPAEIYRQSFKVINAEAQLSSFPDAQHDVVIRMIHACGMVDLAQDVLISDDALIVGQQALVKGSAIICDVEMVRRGIIQSGLAHNNRVLCHINEDVAQKKANEKLTTRSAGALESLKAEISDAIVVIGNAPTALFHLLEMVEDGISPPALIIGCPVGFVGAVESKQALIDFPGNIPFITVRGRRGGSAIAAAALNALSGGSSA